MKHGALIGAVLLAFAATGCATKKGFEVPGQAFGCPVGDAKVSSMDDRSCRPSCAARRAAISSGSTPT